jgi:ABC-type multidrug transport system ATPase subunit
MFLFSGLRGPKLRRDTISTRVHSSTGSHTEDSSSKPKSTSLEIARVHPEQQDIQTPKASLTWRGVNVELKTNGKKLIDNVSGMVSSGRILALMGPSGAGKTTLLNALARRAKYATVTGEVRFAGRQMTSTDLTYVPQFDQVNEVLTVIEHFRLVGRLTSTDKEATERLADDLVNVLGLEDKRDVQVRELTGGEVKRVSIGIGLISSPSVLFLDGEPSHQI